MTEKLADVICGDEDNLFLLRGEDGHSHTEAGLFNADKAVTLSPDATKADFKEAIAEVLSPHGYLGFLIGLSPVNMIRGQRLEDGSWRFMPALTRQEAEDRQLGDPGVEWVCTIPTNGMEEVQEYKGMAAGQVIDLKEGKLLPEGSGCPGQVLYYGDLTVEESFRASVWATLRGLQYLAYRGGAFYASAEL